MDKNVEILKKIKRNEIQNLGFTFHKGERINKRALENNLILN